MPLMYRAAWFGEYPVHATYEIQVFKVFYPLLHTEYNSARSIEVPVNCYSRFLQRIYMYMYTSMHTADRAWCTVWQSYIWYDL